MENASAAELRALVFAQLDIPSVEVYEPLLEKMSAGALGAEDQARLTILRRQADELMFRRPMLLCCSSGAASRVPSLDELRATERTR